MMRNHRSSGPMRGIAAGACLLCTVGAAASCGDDTETNAPITEPETPTASIEVTVVFPDEARASVIASVHLWVLAPGEQSEASCAALVGGTFEPYDLGARTLADVASRGAQAKLLADGVEIGPALVYVEGVDHRGVAELAGCVPVEIAEPSTAATVTLGPAKTFDCSDPGTEDGAPCDDGELCTVGERCERGACGGGLARSCTHLADACNAESCDDELGCIATPLSDGTPCQDGLFCTAGDVCQAGACLGAELDCSPGAAPCQVAIDCDEAAGACIYANAPNGTACDDGVFCTSNDVCSAGSCNGGAVTSCAELDTACSLGTCDLVADACVEMPRNAGVSCDDGLFCTISDVCDGDGGCAGAPRPCSGGTTCAPMVCNDVSDACVPGQAPANTVCNDTDVCTTNDVCNGAGVCAGDPIPNCP